MKIGITGASGFLGTALGKAAAERGHQLVAFSRRSDQHFPWASEEWFTDETGVPPAELLTGLDALVHLAGESVFGLGTPAKKRRIISSRVPVTRAVVSALEKANPRPRILLSASGIGCYGNRGDELLDESASIGTGFFSELCRDWEGAAKHAERLDMRVVLLRTGVVLGKGGGAFAMLKKVFSLGLGGRLGSGRQWMSWIALEDHIRLMLWCLENSQIAGQVNLVSPNPVTNREFTTTLAAAVKRPAFFHAPALALRLLLPGMADQMLLSSQRAVPRVAADLGFQFQHPNLADTFSRLLSA